jgi:hypothetical protein
MDKERCGECNGTGVLNHDEVSGYWDAYDMAESMAKEGWRSLLRYPPEEIACPHCPGEAEEE